MVFMETYILESVIFWRFCLGDTTQGEDAVATSNIIPAAQNHKSFWQILTKLNVSNWKQISKLLPQISNSARTFSIIVKWDFVKVGWIPHLIFPLKALGWESLAQFSHILYFVFANTNTQIQIQKNPFESLSVRESWAFLPHGITNEHSNIDRYQDTITPN